jgi:lysophospholipase L1-like esterase
VDKPSANAPFRADVIDLKPTIVCAGGNDIAGNTGPSTLEMIQNNIFRWSSWQNHNIKVILCSVLPANYFYWSPKQDQPTLLSL